MKTMKKVVGLLLTLAMVCALATPVLAAESNAVVVDLGDGFYAVETLTQYPMTRAGDSVFGNKSAKVYQGSTLIGTATLGAEFDISGSSAKATAAYIDGTGSNGWSYTRGTTSKSGSTASGTAYFYARGVEKSVTITMTCSPSGTIS